MPSNLSNNLGISFQESALSGVWKKQFPQYILDFKNFIQYYVLIDANSRRLCIAQYILCGDMRDKVIDKLLQSHQLKLHN